MTLTPILLANDDHYSALAGVRALRAAGHAPWLAVRHPTYAERSRATAGTVRVPDPASAREEYVAAVVRAAQEIEAQAVLPGNEVALAALAGRSADFPDGIVLGAGSEDIVLRASDKRILAELAGEAGLRTAPSVIVRDGEPFDVRFPAVVKPSRSTYASKGTIVDLPKPLLVRTVEELRALALDPQVPWLVQPYLEGTLAAVCGVAWEGELICAVHQFAHRIFPVDAGVSAFAETVPPDDELEARLGNLLGRIGWSGIFQAQFIRSQTETYLIDLNPRMYGSLALAVSAGLNLPGIWTDLLLGRSPEVRPYRIGARYRGEDRDARAIAAAFKSGDRLGAIRGLLPRRHTVHAIFSLRDPAPMLWLLSRVAGRSPVKPGRPTVSRGG